MLIFARL